MKNNKNPAISFMIFLNPACCLLKKGREQGAYLHMQAYRKLPVPNDHL